MPFTRRKPSIIIWGVDPLEPEPRNDASIAQVLRVLAQTTGALILPITIFVLDEIIDETKHPLSHRLKGSGNQREVEMQTYVQQAQETILKIAADARIPTLLQPRVVFTHAHRLRDAAMALGEIGLQENASMIAVATHGYRGMKRAILGSFAETLILSSSVPVLTIGPEMRTQAELHHILFPTDLGFYADLCFNEVLQLAKDLGAKITVFHSAAIPNDLPVHSNIRSFETVESFISRQWWNDYLNYQKQLAVYQERARRSRIPVEIFLDTSGLDLTTALLRATVEKNLDLIAMPAQSRTFRGIFTGSTARHVARMAPCPVWTLHENPLTQKVRVAG